MKNTFKYVLLAAASVLAFSACNKVEEETVIQNEDDFYYTFYLGNPNTKSVLSSDANGKFGAWESTDQVGTFINSANPGYANIDITASPATFKIYKSGGLVVNDKVSVYYPYNSNTTAIDAVNFEIPVSQSQTGSVFDFDAMPMAGESYTVTETTTTNQTPIGSIELANLGSVIDFQVFSGNATYAGETIISVKFSASKPIAGSFTKNISGIVNNDENTLTITGYSETDVTTSVDTPAAIGATRDAASHVYMVIAPEKDVTGTVLVTTDKAKYTFSMSSAQAFKRGGLKSFGLNLGTCTNRVEEDTPVPTRVGKTIAEILEAMGKSNVANGTIVNPLTFDSVITLSTTGTTNNGKVYGNASEWRLYATGNGNIIISAAAGYELQSVTLTYTKDSSPVFDGPSSGVEAKVSGSSVTYNVTSAGSIRISAVEVKYVAVPVPEGYQLMSSSDDVTTGLYVIAAKVDDKYYGMPNTLLSGTGQISASELTVNSGFITLTNAESYSLSLSKDSNGEITIANSSITLAYSSSTNFSDSETGNKALWTIGTPTKGSFRILNKATNTRVLAYRSSTGKFGAFASSNITASGTDYYDVELFKYNGTVTTKTTPTTTVTPASPIALKVGGTQQLIVDTDSDGAVTYESNATGVATVSASGLITAVAAGTATISVKTAETSTFSAGKTDITVNVSSNTNSTVAQVIAAGAGTYNMVDLLVYHVNGSSVIVGDASGKILLYKSDHGLAVGDKFNLTSATAAIFNTNIIEITGWTAKEVTSSDNAVNHGTALDLTVQANAETLTTDAGYYSAKFVTIKGAQSSRTVDGSYVDVYLNAANAATDGMSVIVTGYIYSFNGTTHTIQATSIAQDPDVAYVKATPASLSWAATETDAKEIAVVVNDNASGYTVSPTSDSNWNILDDGNGTITVSPKAANTSTTAAKSLTLTIANADNFSVNQEVTCTQAMASSGGDPTWTKVTSVSEITSGGTFIIGYQDPSGTVGVIVPMRQEANAESNSYVRSGATANSSTNGTITMSTTMTSASTSAYETVIEAGATTGKVVIKIGSKYIQDATSYSSKWTNACSLVSSKNDATEFTPTISDGVVTLTSSRTVNSQNPKFQYNSSSPRFTCYGTGSQKNLVLYKKN